MSPQCRARIHFSGTPSISTSPQGPGRSAVELIVTTRSPDRPPLPVRRFSEGLNHFLILRPITLTTLILRGNLVATDNDDIFHILATRFQSKAKLFQRSRHGRTTACVVGDFGQGNALKGNRKVALQSSAIQNRPIGP